MSVPGKCPDGGTCHSVGDECASSCYRVSCCEPLSGVFPGDVWPENVKWAAAMHHDAAVPDAIEAGAQALYNMHPEEYRKPLDERHDGDAEHLEAAAVVDAVTPIIERPFSDWMSPEEVAGQMELVRADERAKRLGSIGFRDSGTTARAAIEAEVVGRIAQKVRDSANFIAAEVRRADGKHTMGAGALGETLAESIAARIARGGEDEPHPREGTQ